MLFAALVAAASLPIVAPSAAAAATCFGKKPTSVGTAGDDEILGTRGRRDPGADKAARTARVNGVLEHFSGIERVRGSRDDDVMLGSDGRTRCWGTTATTGSRAKPARRRS